jgi:hypothetical protein
MDRGEAVAGGGSVVALVLEMLKERRDQRRVEPLRADQPRRRPASRRPARCAVPASTQGQADGGPLLAGGVLARCGRCSGTGSHSLVEIAKVWGNA